MKKQVLSLLLVLTVVLVTSPMGKASKVTEEEMELNVFVEEMLKAETELLPETFDYDLMEKVMNEGGERADRLLRHMDEIAKPATASPAAGSDRADQADVVNHYTVEYNANTGETKEVYEDEYYEAPEEVSGYSSESIQPFADQSSLLRAPDWDEYNPQNYSDTKSTFKMYMYKDTSSGTELYHGTGFKVGWIYLGTSGHCLYGGGWTGGGWITRVFVVPSYTTDTPNRPLGFAWGTGNMWCGGDWANAGKYADDWGVLKIDKSIQTGMLTKRCVGDTTSLNGELVRLQGYPAGAYPMFLSWGAVKITDRREVTADYTVYGGTSGGPITDLDSRVLGINQGISGTGRGVFIKFDNWIYNKMLSYETL